MFGKVGCLGEWSVKDNDHGDGDYGHVKDGGDAQVHDHKIWSRMIEMVRIISISAAT